MAYYDSGGTDDHRHSICSNYSDQTTPCQCEAEPSSDTGSSNTVHETYHVRHADREFSQYEHNRSIYASDPQPCDIAHGRRDNNSGRSSDGDSSNSRNAGLIEGLIQGVLGLLVSLSVGTVSIKIALVGLRILTMTTAAGAVGVTTLGTGYLVVRGSWLVIQAARPGVMDTIKAAERVARDARENTLTVFDAAGNLVGGVAQTVGGTVQTAGNLVGGVAQTVGGTVQTAGNLVGGIAQTVTGRVQATAVAATTAPPVGNEDRDSDVIEIEENDWVELQRIIRSGDLGDAVQTSSLTQYLTDPSTIRDHVVHNVGLGNAFQALPLSHPSETGDIGDNLAGPSGMNGGGDTGGDSEDLDGFELIDMHDFEGHVRSNSSSQDDLSFYTVHSSRDREAD